MTRQCSGNSSLCDGRDLLPVRIWPRGPVVMCAQCRRIALEMGAHVVERRVTDLPVIHERRHPRPTWMARLTGREDASWRAA
jgi:hypothetical protein